MQHKNIIRIASLVSAVFFVALCFLPAVTPSVSAEDLSWKDYIQDVNVNAGTITIKLPATPSTFDVYPSGRDTESFNGVEHLYYQFESYSDTGMTYSLQITPCSSNFLYLGNVPDDTELNVWLDIRSVINPEGDTVNGLPTIPAWNFDIGRYYAHMYLFNEAHERIAFRSMEFGHYYIPGETDPDEYFDSETNGTFYASAILSDVLGNMEDTEYLDNALYFRGSYFFENMQFTAYTDCKISVASYELVLHMGSLLSGEGEYSDILEVILAQLAKRGETIDFISGEIVALTKDPESEGNMNNSVNSMNQSSNNLSGVGDALASVDKPNLDSSKFDASALVPFSSFVVLSSPFQAIWENPTLLGILTIVVSLVIVSWIFFGKKGS